MNSPLDNFNIEANFWVVNSQLNIPKEFIELKDKDKSKEKKDSSQLMWAIALITDPKSKFFTIPIQDRKKLVAEDFLKNFNFNWSTLDKQIALYEKLLLSPASRQIALWNRMMEEKTDYLSKLKYASDWSTIEELLLTNEKLFKHLKAIESMLAEEGEEGVVKGGNLESLSEKGEI